MKAISLLSGGLDSLLATKLILEQGIEVEAVNFVTVFCNCTSRNMTCSASTSAAKHLGIKLKVFEISLDYFEVVKNPKHGYGRNLNPCLDCRILMFKKAKKYMAEIGASFVVTGEVLGERPMSQRKEAMRIIEDESGLSGLIVRPLSSKLFNPTIPEEKGWVDRKKFLEIQGRSRKPQIKLADDFGINDYPCPSGGCLLTDHGFSVKMRDLMTHNQAFDTNDVKLLKFGRYFKLSQDARLVVGRDEKGNEKLLGLAKPSDLVFSPADINGPVGVGRGYFPDEEILTASRIIARYSDVEFFQEVRVSYDRKQDALSGTLTVKPLEITEANKLHV